MFLALLVLWLVFAGSITVSNLVLGALISGLITLFCHFFMGYSSRAFLASLKKLGAMLHYVGVLVSEIIKSNIAVIRLICVKSRQNPIWCTSRPGLKVTLSKCWWQIPSPLPRAPTPWYWMGITTPCTRWMPPLTRVLRKMYSSG